ncbi:MAG: hypothetical protein HC869_06490 [Rhodospirillales bacterium]|nr:hypothetical protein [Rhodospirillales bacterium]
MNDPAVRALKKELKKFDVERPLSSEEAEEMSELSQKLASEFERIAMAAVERGEYALPLVLVPYELFFEGNDDVGSIACNVEVHQGVAWYYAAFKRIASDSTVAAIYVEITDVGEVEDDNDSWPFSDKVHVVTKASDKQIEAWRQELQADEVGLADEADGVEVPKGYQVQVFWWD